MKRKMSDKSKMLLFFLFAFAIVAAVYCLVFTKLNEKKDVLLAQNQTLLAEVTELAAMEANKNEVIQDTRDFQEHIGETLGRFPSEVRTQNVIYDLNKMYESIPDVKIQSETYLMNQIFYQPAAGVDANGNPIVQEVTDAAATQNASISAVTADTPPADVVSAAVNYTGYRSDISLVFTAPYNSLKQIIDFIHQSDDRMTITSISMSELVDSDVLTCNMMVSMYAISGTGEIYEQPRINNDFGTIGKVFGND